MKDVISDGNYICERLRSKNHFLNVLEFAISILSIVLFATGCWLLVEQVQTRVQWAVEPIIGPPRTIELLPSIALLLISALLAFLVFRPIYLRSYWEGEIDERHGDTVGHYGKERVFDYSKRWTTLSDASGQSHYAEEYLLNAIVDPKTVYLRIKEELRPSARTLAVKTKLDIAPLSQTCCQSDIPVQSGMRLRKEWSGNREKDRSDDDCEVLIPVVYQKRGELANHLQVQDRSGNPLPTCQTAEVAGVIVSAMKMLIGDCDSGETPHEELWDEYKKGLADTTKTMDDVLVAKVRGLLQKMRIEEWQFNVLDQTVCLLASCYVLCVRVPLKRSAKDAYSILTWQRVPLRLKPRDFIRQLNAKGNPRRASRLIGATNDRLNGIKKSSGMFFYNLANANLAQSYHLMMLGPEDTFCAKGDVLEIPCARTEWLRIDKKPNENSFKCERLRGQRHAHVLWGQAENYHRAVFVFHYVGRPQDLFFAAGLMALVCLVGLVVTMLGAGGGEKLGTDIPAVLLLALSAICPWLYDRERNDRTESSLLDFSAFLTTVASITGLLLFLDIGLGLEIVPGSILPHAWRFLITLEAVDAASLLFLSVIHNSLYKARRLDRTDRKYGVISLLDQSEWVKHVAHVLEKRWDWLYRLLRGDELVKGPLEGVVTGDDLCGPFVASREWPKGWLAVSGSFWWESERERWRAG